MKNKGIFLLNLVLTVLVQVSMVWFLDCGGLWRKGLTSFGFILLGVLNLAYLIAARKRPLNFPVVLVIGLIVAMFGDIVLNVNFIGGALLFAVGHILYVISYGQLRQIGKLDLLLLGIIFAAAALFLLCAPIFDFGDPVMKGICVGYAAVISCMVGKAFGNAVREHTVTAVLLAAGSVLFFVSDLMLVLYEFADAPHIIDTICVVTYYPAQCVLAHAMFWYKGKSKA